MTSTALAAPGAVASPRAKILEEMACVEDPGPQGHQILRRGRIFHAKSPFLVLMHG